MPNVIYTVKKIEEATRRAAQEFGVSEALITVKVMEEKKGLFGRVKELTVEASYEEPFQTESVQTDAPAEQTETVVSAAAEETVLSAAEEVTAAPAKAAEESTSLEEDIAAAVPLSLEELPAHLLAARKYIIDIYEKLGVEVTVTVAKIANGILMNVDSEAKSGTIIGRRGETLDSIQYLASIIANRGMNDYNRLMLDSNGYRVKRRKTLEQLAEKIARNVLRNGRTTTLEPMNPYERRIIHSKISEIEGVVSHSVGEDPYRKVVVAPVAGAAKSHRNRSQRGGNDNRNRRGGHGGNGGGKRSSRPQKRPEDFKPSSLDNMKTSFEKDYKKPRPEDEIHTGLYGKIEL